MKNKRYYKNTLTFLFVFSFIWLMPYMGNAQIQQDGLPSDIPQELLDMIEYSQDQEEVQRNTQPAVNVPSTPAPRSRTNVQRVNAPINRRTQPSNRIFNASEDNEPVVSSQDIKGSKKEGMLDVLDLKNMDILDVLKLISQKSGLNIVAGQNVKGRVTVYLKNVSVEEALQIIVDAYGWAFKKEGNIIKVMAAADYETRYGHRFGMEKQTKIVQIVFGKAPDIVAILNEIKSDAGKVVSDEKSGSLILIDKPEKILEMERVILQVDVPVRTEVFQLSYATANDLSTKISEVLTPNLGTMKYDERSNKIIVSDTNRQIEKIRHIIDEFDQQDKEVLIEAKIVQIVLSDQYKLGVDWEVLISDFHNLNLKSNFDVLVPTDKSGQLAVGTLADDDYSVFVEALNTIGVTDILSSPRIAAVNNKEAKILVGSTEPYVTTTTTTPSSGPTTTAESVNFIEVGVKLFVTPTIHDDDFITMKIKPEVSSVVRSVETGNNNSIPVVETSEAETTVMVKNGATIVIGGLIKDENIEVRKSVPLLGSIPFLGAAFRNVDDKKTKTEIVIFLTPQVITGEDPSEG